MGVTMEKNMDIVIKTNGNILTLSTEAEESKMYERLNLVPATISQTCLNRHSHVLLATSNEIIEE